jgi:alkylhydroperoxidase/carboxymuconolactone decarboxylase family protein YurZ
LNRSKKKTAAAASKKRSTPKSTPVKARARGLARLKRKYGAAAIDGLARVHPDQVSEHIAWCDALDQNFTKLWLDFTYGGMAGRGILDERTRCLVLVGQFLVMDEMEQFTIHIRNALRHATSREVLEVILQATVYLGYPKIMRAARVFTKTLKDLGRLGEITRTQLPIDGHQRGRSLKEERKTWGMTEADCPRREELLRKFGWEGLSTGFRLQPSHHHKTVEQLERVDAHFLKIWLDFIYAGMYARRVLDDRTRILCVIGELFVMGEFVQIENHIRNALLHSATPREVLEVILQSTIYAGMPRFVRVVALLERVLDEEGRLGELTDTQLPLPARCRQA